MAPSKKQIPHVEVDDPAAAFHNAEALGRKLLAVPKSEIDRRLAKEKQAKHKARKR